MTGAALDKLSVIVVGLCLLSGCSFDSAEGHADGGEATDGSSSSVDLDTMGPASPDSTAGESAGGENADDGTTGDGSDSGQPPDSCDVDCGEGGSCEFDEAGAPMCSCVEGYAAYGLRCLPCTPTNGVFDVDVPSVAVSASFTLAGESFPMSVYEHGHIVLRDPASGDELELGDTRDGGGTVTVVPGSYEVLYTMKLGGDVVPANRGAKLTTVVIPSDAEAHELAIDVPVVELSGSFTFNDGPTPEGQYENGTVVLVDRTTGDEVVLGETRTGEYRIKVVPGAYDVHYRRKLAETIAPINGDAPVTTVIVDGAEPAQSFDVDVDVVTLSGTFTIDGATPPLGAYENGRIVLRHAVTGDEVMLGQTRDGSYTVPVVAGSYQLIYQRLTGGTQVPINRAALLDEPTIGGEGEGEAQSLDVDVATAVVTGVITVGDAVPPSDPGDDGLIILRNLETGDEAPLGNTANGAYSQRVVRGPYDVYYRQETSSGGVPVNTNALLQSIDVQGGANLDIDIPMVTVSAAITVGGQIPPSSVYDDGVLYLRNTETGDSVLLGNTRLAALERPVVPGNYDVLYVVEAAGPTMPINASSHLSSVDLRSTTALDIDIPVAVLQGAITVAGEAPPQSAYDRAVLLLHDVETSDVVYLGASNASGFARTLTAGTYVLVYQALTSTGLVPANTKAGLACLELSAP